MKMKNYSISSNRMTWKVGIFNSMLKLISNSNNSLKKMMCMFGGMNTQH